jgi:hypothetical protein
MSVYLLATLDLMKKAGEMKDLSGKDKKAYVLDELRKALELPEDIENLIVAVIDALIDVEKGRLVLNPVVEKGCTGCIGFLKKSCRK